MMLKKWNRVLKVLLALVLVVGSCMTVRAASTVDDLTENEMHELAQKTLDYGAPLYTTFPYYVVMRESDTKLVYLYSTYPIQYSGGKLYYCGAYKTGTYKIGESKPSLATSGKSSSYTYVDDGWSDASNILISSHNITYKGVNDVFFHRSLLARITLKTVVPEEMMKEIVAILPLLIPLLISLLGLRKGLRFISTILRTA